MECELTCWDGRTAVLPDLLEWRFTYTAGSPCDAFFLRCLWDRGVERTLSDAVRLTAREKGEVVFHGVVDEFTCAWGSGGGTLELHGRGMAALLLDNEAQGADYQVATLADILRDHVAPYGIQVAETARLPAVAGFAVKNGSSEWQVLYDFARCHGGVAPRFNRQGQLVVAPWQDGQRRVLDAGSGLTALSYREKRYGVLSEVLVRDRTTLAVQRVADEDFIRRGGACRRVLTMPGRSSYQAMRYSGQYQLERAREGRLRVELALGRTFAAWPGELVEIGLERPAVRGVWRVEESETGVNQDGAFTRLGLGTA